MDVVIRIVRWKAIGNNRIHYNWKVSKRNHSTFPDNFFTFIIPKTYPHILERRSWGLSRRHLHWPIHEVHSQHQNLGSQSDFSGIQDIVADARNHYSRFRKLEPDLQKLIHKESKPHAFQVQVLHGDAESHQVQRVEWPWPHFCWDAILFRCRPSHHKTEQLLPGLM